MKVAVVGAGAAGLTCGLRAAEAGHEVDVYERWPGLGGQAATIDVGGGVRIERYYHYLFTSDTYMTALFEELGLAADLEPHESDNAIFVDGRTWPFNGPGDLLRFSPIPLVTRLRMALALVRLQLFGRDMAAYEGVTAHDWITHHMGRPAWDGLWGPVMRGKFGARAQDISMVWIWDKLCRRRNIRNREATQEVFLYPRRSFEPLFVELARRIEARGGRVLIDRPVARLDRDDDGTFLVTPAAPDSFRRGLDPREFEHAGPPERYEAVVCCVPNHTFHELLEPALEAAVGEAYLDSLQKIEYFTALTMLLEVERPLTDHFWLNIADRRVPFVGIIEHTNFVGPELYGGRHFAYLTHYVPAGHELTKLSPDELLDRYEEGLRLINPAFERSWIRQRWRFEEPAGQPIVTVGYRDLIPAMQTPVEGLQLVNTTQVYPEDRGTNNAVRDGARAAELLAP